MTRPFHTPHSFRRLKAVEPGHLYIEKHGGEALLIEALKRFFARVRFHVLQTEVV